MNELEEKVQNYINTYFSFLKEEGFSTFLEEEEIILEYPLTFQKINL